MSPTSGKKRSLSAISPPLRKVLAFTCGDPSGVGPRAAIAASRRLPKNIQKLFIGERIIWHQNGWKKSDGPIYDTELHVKVPRPGHPDPNGGLCSAAAFESSIRLASRGLVGAIVTAPISKEMWKSCGYPYQDHTQRLAEFSHVGQAEMILAVPSKKIWCVLATRHLAFKDVIKHLESTEVFSSGLALHQSLLRLKFKKPKIALCGLNPHAGEEGLFGDEEKNILLPARKRLVEMGVNISTPLPADSAWRLHIEGKFDGLLCLYHDQALIGLKAIGGLAGVNWTQSIPFIRTSPAHGTAWDAAKSGHIDISATLEAAKLALRLMSD